MQRRESEQTGASGANEANVRPRTIGSERASNVDRRNQSEASLNAALDEYYTFPNS